MKYAGKLQAVLIEAPEDGSFLDKLARELRQTLLQFGRQGPVTDAIKRAVGALKNFSITGGLDPTGSLEFGIKPPMQQGVADGRHGCCNAMLRQAQHDTHNGA